MAKDKKQKLVNFDKELSPAKGLIDFDQELVDFDVKLQPQAIETLQQTQPEIQEPYDPSLSDMLFGTHPGLQGAKETASFADDVTNLKNMPNRPESACIA